MALLSPDECKEVERAIADFERRTSTELVVAVVPRSGDYALGRALVAFAWALALALGLLRWVPAVSPLFVVLLEIPAAIVVYVVFGIASLGRLLIAPAQAARAVQQRSFALFAERGLHDTRQRTGMLILLSELERRVVILGDRAIHERVGDAGWQAHVLHITESIKAGQAKRGLIDVIGRLEKVHAELLPVPPDDRNELPDEIIHD